MTTPVFSHRVFMPWACLFLLCLLITRAIAVLAAGEDCMLDEFPAEYVAAFEGASAMPNYSCYQDQLDSMERARELRNEVISLLDRNHNRVGYKIAGQDAPMRELFKFERPLFGVFYEGATQASGTEFRLDLAEGLIVEADLGVYIGDEAINEAQSLTEALPHLDAIVAYIEVPGRAWVSGRPFDGQMLQATNLMTGWGVVGDSIPVTADADFLRKLEDMRVRMTDNDGSVLKDVEGRFLGDNPLNGVMTAIEGARELGERLEPGDFIGLGAFGGPAQVHSGLAVEVTYEGLADEPLTVSASFK